MKIALIGGTGFVGSAILKEALDRGHEVTAIVRHTENYSPIRSFILRKETSTTPMRRPAWSPSTMPSSAPSIRDGPIPISTTSR